MKIMQIQIAAFLFFFFVQNTLSAQVEWVGGFPGQETNWEQPRNWSNNQVPGSEDMVRIPDLSTQGAFYPVIETEIEEVLHLVIEGSAQLTVSEEGLLTINADFVPGYGIYLTGYLNNMGTIVLENTIDQPILGVAYNLENQGGVFLVDAKTDELRVYTDQVPVSDSVANVLPAVNQLPKTNK